MSAQSTRAGKTTIPKPAWSLLGLKSGNAVDVQITESEQVVLVTAGAKPSTGCLAALRVTAAGHQSGVGAALMNKEKYRIFEDLEPDWILQVSGMVADG